MRAADALDGCGRVGYFFVTCNYIGTTGFVGRGDIRELVARGHVVGSHSCSHPLRMGHCSRAQLVDEWTRSRAILESIVGTEVRVGSVPGGDFAPVVAGTAADSGYTLLFTSEPTCVPRLLGPLTLIGRYTIQHSTSAATVAGLVRGAWMPRARQAVLWTAKKATKRIAGGGYLRLRKLLLRHGDEVQWGDQSL
jgi:peptidoglycan/xylan/chitin deacetylase (PgdA/CDA1 family)